MLGILWFTVWATVCEAFYEDNNWYTAEDGVFNGMSFDWERYVRDNFSDSLRTLAKVYNAERDGDDEMTMQKAKSRLRMLKVFKYTGNSYDFEESNGNMLPLADGAKYCTMGRHTKVDCNHCTCVAGQLYMCTGMICPEQVGRPQFGSTCREGKKRKIDSCNYCVCHNGHDFCSTKDCRLDHGHSSLRRPVCQDGQRRITKCNRCVCHNGEEYCTRKTCKESQQVPKDDVYVNQNKPIQHKSNMNGHVFGTRCVKGTKRKLDSCNQCYCHKGQWFCEKKVCSTKNVVPLSLNDIELDSSCELGTKKSLDCHRCVCFRDGWRCHRKKACHVVAEPNDLLLNRRIFNWRLPACIVGQVMKQDTCNLCWCGLNLQWQCTEYDCTPLAFDKSKNKEEKLCDQYDIKYTACGNRCECVAHHWACTQKPCQKQISSGEKVQDGEKYMYVEACKPGDTRKLDVCNSCYCRYGQWFCQTKDCGEHKPGPVEPNEHPNKNIEHTVIPEANNNQDNQEVPANIIFNDDDDNNDDGDIDNNPDDPVNTEDEKKVEEPVFEDDDNVCIPGKRKKNSCYNCRCGRDKRWNCRKEINRRCRLFFANGDVLRSEPECTIGTRQRLDACNYCWCNYDQKWLCSNHTCDSSFGGYDYNEPSESDSSGDIDFAGIFDMDLLRSAPECTLGRRQRLDACNYCWCNHDNKWLCSNHTCASLFAGRLREGNQLRAFETLCEERTIREVDACNYCACFEGVEYCSQIPCRNNQPKDIPKCESGWKKTACNSCFCRKGVWLCENEQCDEPENKDAKTLSNPSKGRREGCIPGDGKAKNYCFYCYCNPSRKWHCIPLCKRYDKSQLSLRSDNYDFADILGIVGIERCESGTTRQADICNKCYCRGGLWFCENNQCGNSAVKAPSDSAEPECISGKPLPPPDQCNMCVCFNSKILCTEIVCSLRALVDIPKCKSGMKRKADACNSCFCRKGVWFCENKQCGEPENKDARYDNSELSLRSDNYDFADILGIGNQLRAGDTLCKEGTQREVDACNYCVCYEGVEYCSQNPCWNNQPMPPYEIQPECLPGKPVPPPDQCNKCVCLYGEILCTEDPCDLRSSAPIVLTSKCKRGSSKKYKCHLCSCYADGWKCRTRKKCRIDPITGEPYLRQRVECYPGESYRVNSCNVCYCSMKYKYECQNICGLGLRTGTSEKRCNEGSRREVDACNYCICKNGVEFCTKTSCLDNQPTYLRQLKEECRPGDSYREDSCNVCYCSTTGTYLCARICKIQKKTRSSLRTNEKRCDEGSRREVDACNYCICKNGVEFCTKTPCLDNQPIQQRSKDDCVEGDKYKLDDGCNYCVCQGGQEFCTARACLVKVAENNANQNTVCSDGEITPAKDNCNMCVCLQGKLTCTNRDCSDMGRNGADASFMLSKLRDRKSRNNLFRKKKPIQVCIPGEMYIDEGDDPDCPNNCICDRNEFLCTKRQCNKNRQIVYSKPQMSGKKGKIRYPKQVLKQEMCEENQPLPSDDPCNICMCLNDRKVCTIIPCSDAEETKIDSDEEFLGFQLVKPINFIKGNMEKKKKGTFCEPFTFFSPDNNRFCRNCFCLHNGLALCLLNQCKYSKDVPHNISPQELNDVCTPGETGYPTKCVTCTCSDDAKWFCTRDELEFCQERDCDEKDEFHMGFYPFCAGCKCAVKEWFCSIEAETCQGNVTCPIGTFIHNPNQHCSICLCGGEEEGSSNMCFTEAKCVRHVISHLKN